MTYCKNTKGIVHNLNVEDPQVKKWLKSDQVTKLTDAEIAAHLGKKVKVAKAVKPEPEANPEANPDPDAEVADKVSTPIELLRLKYTEHFAEVPNNRWTMKTLEKKLAEINQ